MSNDTPLDLVEELFKEDKSLKRFLHEAVAGIGIPSAIVEVEDLCAKLDTFRWRLRKLQDGRL